MANGPYASQSIGMGGGTAQQGDALLSSSSRGWRGIHAGKGCPGFSQESCSTRIEPASPTLINGNGKHPHAPVFSAHLLISSGYEAGKLATGSHITAPFYSSFSVLISAGFFQYFSLCYSQSSQSRGELQYHPCCQPGTPAPEVLQASETGHGITGCRAQIRGWSVWRPADISPDPNGKGQLGGRGGHVLRSCWRQPG